ncbi:L,D-transpeptidase [Roseivivax marinus]|uniref:L,D-transpeptidase n=1 Tax=Roseivivax marinus TaxID=1379903 RepID=UPI003516FB77
MRRRELIAGGAALAGLPLAARAQNTTDTTEAAAGMLDGTGQPMMAPHIVQLVEPFPPGEVHVFPGPFRLYWTLEDAYAWVYPIRIGRDNLYEAGEYYVGAKKEWPSWTPTPDMIEREPEKYKQYEDGMPGGPNNPLGARALYLFTEERGDTFLRIHGTNDPNTIGRAVSNGCAGLINEHMINLYDKVPMGARVVLYPKA